MKALILAAGYATRLYPLTKDRPKVLLPVGEKTIVDYICKQIIQIPEIDEIIVVSNHRFIAQFNDWAAEAAQILPVSLTILDDETTQDGNKLGAVGDIQFTIEQLKLDEDLLVIAGDNLFTYRLADAAAAFFARSADMILGNVVPADEDIHRFAVAEVGADGRVLSLEEKPSQPKSDIAVYATYFYRKETLPLFKTYLDSGENPDAPGYFPSWLYHRAPLYLYKFHGECFDIGTPSAYAGVQTLVNVSPSYADKFSGIG